MMDPESTNVFEICRRRFRWGTWPQVVPHPAVPAHALLAVRNGEIVGVLSNIDGITPVAQADGQP